MTTRLNGPSTRFLPFNRGHDGGAGNPPVAGRHRTCYLWEEVWQRDNLLDLVGRFLHLQTEEEKDPDTGQVTVKETMVFPRYHQWDCVRRLLAAARETGAGTNFLSQHSAGSGKSNTIAWVAHRLAALHDDQDRKVYDAVVVLTDRKVLDQQLQNTVYQFEHKSGVVEKIDTDSAQLARALTAGVPIIISTIHKFGFIQDKIQALPDRRYAIIVDEAHSSQTGDMAVTLKELLSDSALAARLEAEGEDLSAPDQLALRAALFRGPQPNMSFFAFTATPKHKTLELFGHKGSDGKPAPFHLYSMRQAIEEGFILDVLKGYMTYQRFFQLAKQVADDPVLDKKKAAAALARFVSLHPTNIAQKTQIILEHFRACVMHQLQGRAKAMLVTSSRLMAVKYKQSCDAYLIDKGKDPGYSAIRCLVAFSGEVQDDQVRGVTYTEPQMNRGSDGKPIKETELPARFASSVYQVLIVANKYQTGFDQPLLCAMYVDKRLDGIQAVQTLSRLNRTYGRLLLRKPPPPAGGAPVDLGDDVVLASYKLKLDAAGDLTLKAGGSGELPGPEYTGTGTAKPPQERLSTIIEVINTRFGTDFDAQDLVDGVTAQLVADADLQQAARVNDKGNFGVPFREALDDALVTRHEKHGDFINTLFQDEALGAFFRNWMLDQVYAQLRGGSDSAMQDH